MELQGEGKNRKATKLGANRLMTFKESNDIPEHNLRKELLRLENRRERAEVQYKREEEAIERILNQILDSLGNYVNLSTRQAVHDELRREILRGLVSSKRQEPVLPAVFKDDEADDHRPSRVDPEVLKKIKRTQKLKEQKKRAMRPVKERPSYKALLRSERTDRRKINNSSFVEILHFYGQEDEPEKINFWMDVLYPTTRLHSPSLCGIKKRLERYKNRLLMERDPMDNGVEWFFKESKVGSKYPEIVKLRRPRCLLPPINKSGSLTSQSDSDSQGSKGSVNKERRENNAQLRKNPISAAEFLFGSRPGTCRSDEADRQAPDTSRDPARDESNKNMDAERVQTKKRIQREEERIKERRERTTDVVDGAQAKKGNSSEDGKSKERGKNIDDTVQGKKGILREEEGGKERRGIAKKVSIQSPTAPDEGDFSDVCSNAQFSETHEETREEADRRRRISLDIATLEKRKKNLTDKEVKEAKPQRVEQLKAEIAEVMRLRAEGKEKEIDYHNYFQRRRSLALLMEEDEEEEMEFLKEGTKNWEDVKKCKYIRGYDPPEMRGTDDHAVTEFVFWKGDYERDETFIKERKEMEEQKAEEPTQEKEAPRSRKKTLTSVGSRASLLSTSSDGTKKKS